MEASRNRDSPKLQFSKEESARLVLEKKKAKVERRQNSWNTLNEKSESSVVSC